MRIINFFRRIFCNHDYEEEIILLTVDYKINKIEDNNSDINDTKIVCKKCGKILKKEVTH